MLKVYLARTSLVNEDILKAYGSSIYLKIGEVITLNI